MGNSASALPYTIGKQVSIVNDGWALHDGTRKSDNENVSVFVGKKPTLCKTPLHRNNPNISNQLVAAKHHYIHCKKLRHPNILKVYATLDTDNPNDTAPTGIGSTNNSNNTTSKVTTTASNTTNETGDLIIVTEPCITLDEWMNKYEPTLEQIAWGLESIVKAVGFLHDTAQFIHGNVSPTSFYVTKSGDIKLWNFSLVTHLPNQSSTSTTGTTGVQIPLSRYFIDHESLVTPDLYRSPERKEQRWDVISISNYHPIDSYSLGILIEHYLFKSSGGVPAKLTKAVQRLLTTNIKMRPKLLPLLKCPIFDTPYQKIQLQLDELTVASCDSKITFWSNASPMLQAQIIPELLAVYKLLPYILHNTIDTICTNDTLKVQDIYRREVQSTLAPLFYIAETYLNKDDAKRKLSSAIRILFAINDRAIRGSLLQKAQYIQSTFDDDLLNTGVFEPMCSGFADSSHALRELTLKATSVLVPHLTAPNLEKLARYLVRLQNDTEASIRTNTVIFFSKLAPYLTEMTRHKMLLPAYMRAMKDPFTPCRMASIRSTIKSIEFFTPIDIASRVLPTITPQLLDPSPDVRLEAFAAVDELLTIIRTESDRLATIPQPIGNLPVPPNGVVTGPSANGTAVPMQQFYNNNNSQQHPQQQPPTAVQQSSTSAPASASSGYFSSWIGSKGSSSTNLTTTTTASTSTGSLNTNQPPAMMSVGVTPTYPTPQLQQQQQQQQPQSFSTTMNMVSSNVATSLKVQDDDDDWSNDGDNNMNDNNNSNIDNDGWDDVDDDIDHFPFTANNSSRPVMMGSTNTGAINNSNSTTTTSPASIAPVSGNSSSLFSNNSSAGNDEDEFFDTFDKPVVKPLVGIRKPGMGAKLIIPKKTTTTTATGGSKLAVSKPVITKLSPSNNNNNKKKDDIPDGWDDF